jgi:hypothetical protein
MREKKSSIGEQGSAIYRDQLITVGDLESFKHTLLEEIRLILHESPTHQAKQWLKSVEVRKMLGISTGTLQNLRVNRTLSYTKIGGIVFYRYDDIARLLNSKTSK